MKTPGKLLYLSREEVKAGDGAGGVFGGGGGGPAAPAAGPYPGCPPRTEVLPRPEGFLHAMPCAISGGAYGGLKWISGYDHNPSRGLPALMGLMVLNDGETGAPLAVMDCMEVTSGVPRR